MRERAYSRRIERGARPNSSHCDRVGHDRQRPCASSETMPHVGCGLTVSEATGDGIPRFAALRLGIEGPESAEVSPPMRQNESEVPEVAEAAE